VAPRSFLSINVLPPFGIVVGNKKYWMDISQKAVKKNAFKGKRIKI